MTTPSEYEYDDDSEYDRSSTDTLDDLLARFNISLRPEYALKIRDGVGPLVYGAELLLNENLREPRVAVMCKPVNKSAWIRRLRVDLTSGDVSVRSRKLRILSVLTLDAEAVLNPVKKSRDCRFRLATTWDASGGRVEKKSKFETVEGLKLCMTWTVNYSLPEVTGNFNNSGESRGVETSLGYAHGSVSKLELALWPRTLLDGEGLGHQIRDETESNTTASANKKEELKTLLGSGDGEASLIDQFVSKLQSWA